MKRCPCENDPGVQCHLDAYHDGECRFLSPSESIRRTLLTARNERDYP